MYVVESKGGAIACMLLALFLLGTWPAIGSSTPDMPNFITQLSQDNWPCFICNGGRDSPLPWKSGHTVCFCFGWFVSDRSDHCKITVVIGTVLNYFLDGKINRADILFPGVACFLIAVCLGSAVHSSNAADNKVKLDSLPSDKKGGEKALQEIPNKDGLKDLESGNGSAEKANFGTADFLVQLENQRAIKVFGKRNFIGLAITFFAGACFSLFSPAFNLATNDQWHTLKEGVPLLVVYTAFFYFSLSCFFLGIILNITFLYHPVLGLPKTSFKAYLKDWDGRGWALLAGLICGFGNGLQFMGGQAAGYAAADAVQALPLNICIAYGHVVMFIAAVAILMASSGHRS
ncbi:hypothetical protein M0R45_002268 [Rubus argutus]|uniref:Uncharacterized protein n=1 Tax=Rubus argutus TaxID=59490 RepID=A0AAW1VIH1_RUBAR